MAGALELHAHPRRSMVTVRAALVVGLMAAMLAVVGASRQAHAGVGAGDCTWVAKADSDRANIAYPDEGAQYWLATFAVPQGDELVLRGQFPLARYMSFHVYEGSIPVDGLADVAIAPSSGVNPFVAGAKRSARGTYEIRLDGTQPRPADDAPRQPNTLYAGRGLNGEPLVVGTILYRVYLGDGDEQGAAPLPRLVYRESATGREIEPPADCRAVRSPTPPLGGNGIVRDTSLPANSPTRVSAAPTWQVARSEPSTVASPAGTDVRSGNPFFANFDNVYLKTTVWKDAGDVIVIRAKAPTFPDTRGAKRMGRGQLRYWSFCTNELATTRYVGCVADEGATVDRDGFVTVVVSDAAHKPASLLATDNWLPWGPYADTFLIYRQMLPAPDYSQAIANVTNDSDEAAIASTMGDYFPRLSVCSSASFAANRCS